MNGKIALIARGGCAFFQKFAIAESQGAVAVILVNWFDDAIVLADGPPIVGIPAVVIGRDLGDSLIENYHSSGTPLMISFDSPTIPVDVTLDVEPMSIDFPGGNYATLNIPPPVDGYGFVRLLETDKHGNIEQVGQFDLPETLDPAAPVNFPVDLAVHGHDAFIAWDGIGVFKVDVKEPESPKIKAIGAADNAFTIDADGSLLVVGDGGNKFPTVANSLRIFKQ